MFFRFQAVAALADVIAVEGGQERRTGARCQLGSAVHSEEELRVNGRMSTPGQILWKSFSCSCCWLFFEGSFSCWLTEEVLARV